MLEILYEATLIGKNKLKTSDTAKASRTTLKIMAVYNQNQPFNTNQNQNVANNKKSKNLQRAGMVAGGVGVAGVGAAVAANLVGGDSEDENLELRSEDLLAGANANDSGEEVEAKAPAANYSETHNTHEVHNTREEIHIIEDGHPEDGGRGSIDNHGGGHGAGEPEVHTDETAIIVDEEGNVIAAYDEGTIDGKKYVMFDSDLNGKGDMLAYDENGNGQFEETEIHQLDNASLEVGQGEKIGLYAYDGEEVVKVDEFSRDELAQLDEIHNDFEDDKHVGDNLDDLAHNNPDYNNHGGDQYSAGMDHDATPHYGEADDFSVNDHHFAATDDFSADAHDFSAPADDFSADTHDYTADNHDFTTADDFSGADDFTADTHDFTATDDFSGADDFTADSHDFTAADDFSASADDFSTDDFSA